MDFGPVESAAALVRHANWERCEPSRPNVRSVVATITEEYSEGEAEIRWYVLHVRGTPQDGWQVTGMARRLENGQTTQDRYTAEATTLTNGGGTVARVLYSQARLEIGDALGLTADDRQQTPQEEPQADDQPVDVPDAQTTLF